MIYTIILIIIAIWLAGFVLEIAGSLIHLLLLVALAIFIFNRMSGRK